MEGKMETGANESIQKRRFTRIDYEHDLDIVIGEKHLSGRTANISPGGTFVIIDEELELGVKLTISLQLPGVNKVSEIPCIVRWSKAGQGIGLQFERLRAIEIWALNKLIRENGTA